MSLSDSYRFQLMHQFLFQETISKRIWGKDNNNINKKKAIKIEMFLLQKIGLKRVNKLKSLGEKKQKQQTYYGEVHDLEDPDS